MSAMRVQNFVIHGLNGVVCKRRIEDALESLPGVTEAKAHAIKNTLKVTFNEELCSVEKIITTIQKVGCFQAQMVSEPWQMGARDIPLDIQLRRRMIASILLSILIMVLSVGPSYGFDFVPLANANLQFQLGLCIFVMALHYQCFWRGFKNFLYLTPEVNSLLTLATLSLFIYSCFNCLKVPTEFPSTHLSYNFTTYFGTIAGIFSLYSLAQFLENKARYYVSSSLAYLYNLTPKTVIRRRDKGQDKFGNPVYIQEEISIKEIQIGDILIARSGSKIGADGLVVDGNAYIDERSLRGYLYLQHKTVGSKVIAGTLLKHGWIAYKVNKTGYDTTIAQILALLNDTNSGESALSLLADRIAFFLVTAVVLLAGVTFYVWMDIGAPVSHALSYAVAVLMVVCPAAVSLSAPISIMLTTIRAVNFGIIIKDPVALENLSQMDILLFGKAGIISKGSYRVAHLDVQADCPLSTIELLHIVRLLEEPCQHVLSQSLILYIEEVRQRLINASSPIVREKLKYLIDSSFVTEWQYHDGLGVSAKIKGHQYYIGSSYYVVNILQNMRSKQDYLRRYENHGLTTLYLFDEQQILAAFALYDEIKADAPHVVRILEKMDIRSILVSGDSYKVVEKTAQSASIDTFRARYLPQDRLELIRSLERNEHVVGIVNSGKFNFESNNNNDGKLHEKLCDVCFTLADNPELKSTQADIVLMHNQLMDLVPAVLLSKAMLKNIRHNLLLVLGFNVVGLPIAAGCFADLGLTFSPLLAFCFSLLGTIGVICNALRLKFSNLSYKTTDGEIIEVNEHKTQPLNEGQNEPHSTKKFYLLSKRKGNKQGEDNFDYELGVDMGFVQDKLAPSKGKLIVELEKDPTQTTLGQTIPTQKVQAQSDTVHTIPTQTDNVQAISTQTNTVQTAPTQTDTIQTTSTQSQLVSAKQSAESVAEFSVNTSKAANVVATANQSRESDLGQSVDHNSTMQLKSAAVAVSGLTDTLTDKEAGEFKYAELKGSMEETAQAAHNLALSNSKLPAQTSPDVQVTQDASSQQQVSGNLQQETGNLKKAHTAAQQESDNLKQFNATAQQVHTIDVNEGQDDCELGAELGLQHVVNNPSLMHVSDYFGNKQNMPLSTLEEDNGSVDTVTLAHNRKDSNKTYNLEFSSGNVLSGLEHRSASVNSGITLGELNDWYQKHKHLKDQSVVTVETNTVDPKFTIKTIEVKKFKSEDQSKDSEEDILFASAEIGYVSCCYFINIHSLNGNIAKIDQLKHKVCSQGSVDLQQPNSSGTFLQARPAVNNAPTVVVQQILEEVKNSEGSEDDKELTSDEKLYVNELMREVTHSMLIDENRQYNQAQNRS